MVNPIIPDTSFPAISSSDQADFDVSLVKASLYPFLYRLKNRGAVLSWSEKIMKKQ
jgi:hypothetical protein